MNRKSFPGERIAVSSVYAAIIVFVIFGMSAINYLAEFPTDN